MLRPLFVDFLGLLVPLGLGAMLFFAGRAWHRWAVLPRVLGLVVSLGLVLATVLIWFRPLPDGIQAHLSAIGGATVLMAVVSLFLLGVVWSVPGRSFSNHFLLALTCVAGVLILIESGGSLWWRLGATDTWLRQANAAGLLRQSSGATCSPTAAVMLLARYGIVTSEGEMAYLAGTSLLGTDAHAIARALSARAGSEGYRVEVGRPDITQAATWVPFVAHLRGEQLGHAVLVEEINDKDVRLADPLDGHRHTLTRAEFERAWDHTAVRLVNIRADGSR